jgi:hypothetical protein
LFGFELVVFSKPDFECDVFSHISPNLFELKSIQVIDRFFP